MQRKFPPSSSMLPPPPRSFYSAFDLFPSAKGASIHIERMSQTLFECSGSGILFTLGDPSLPDWQQEGPVEIIRFSEAIPNFLDRVHAFRNALAHVAKHHAKSLAIAHFRDPWSGIALLDTLPPQTHFIYEVNGLPSIELPYRYPRLSTSTLDRIRTEERRCWDQAAQIITPARCIADNLVRLGANPNKIVVIPNGADLPRSNAPKPDDAPDNYIIYLGALQRWQGVDTLLRAFARLADLSDLKLLICSSSTRRQSKAIRKLARNLELEPRILWKERLPRSELLPYLQNAKLSIAPLAECSRNIAQGCCPLKVLESLAASVPVVASHLPCISEIITDRTHGRLVPPDRPSDLARAIRLLLENPEEHSRLAANGRQLIESALTWEHAQTRLADLYQPVLPNTSTVSI